MKINDYNTLHVILFLYSQEDTKDYQFHLLATAVFALLICDYRFVKLLDCHNTYNLKKNENTAITQAGHFHKLSDFCCAIFVSYFSSVQEPFLPTSCTIWGMSSGCPKDERWLKVADKREWQSH